LSVIGSYNADVCCIFYSLQRLLEARYEAHRGEQGMPDHRRELSMRSLKRLINQLQEEIARFESRSSLGAGGR